MDADPSAGDCGRFHHQLAEQGHYDCSICGGPLLLVGQDDINRVLLDAHMTMESA